MARPTTITINTGSAQYTGLQNWWPLDQASGGTAVDEIAGSTATLKFGAVPNGSSYTTGWGTDAETGYALLTTRTDATHYSYGLASPVVTAPTITDAFSLSFWIKKGSTNNCLAFEFENTTGNRSYILFRTTGSKLNFNWSDNTDDDFWGVTGDSTLPNDSNWHLCTMTFSGSGAISGVKLYLDGAVDTVTTQDFGTLNPSEAFDRSNIARASVNGSDNYIVDCRYYNVELSAALVAAMYAEATRWELYTAPPPPDAPVISATAGNTIVTLSWAAVDDADTYSIYRGTSSGSHSLIQSLCLSTSFIDTGLTNGQTYYYVVTAVSSAGESDDSNEAQATPTNQVTLTPVTGFSGFPTNQRTIPVDWNRVKKRLQRRDEEELLFILGITDRPPNRR